MFEALVESREATERAGVQHTDALTATVLERLSPGTAERATAVRWALANGTWTARRPFAGAVDLLDAAHRQGLTTVLISNTAWHSEADYRTRLGELGLGARIDHVVSSFDVGARKPDRRMFLAAAARARCPLDACVMAGDSESNDIAPAHRLGMRTIRVTVQHPLAGPTLADAVAATLAQAMQILEGWCVAAPGSA